MVRKILLSLMLALLLLPAAALADVQIVDDANVITQSNENRISEVIDAIEREHQIDIVVLVTYDVPDDYSDSLYRVEAYADDYYDYNGYGMGDDYSGLIYLIDLNNRVQWISTHGVLEKYMGDNEIDRILDASESHVRYDQYGSGALAAVEEVGEIMAEARRKGYFEYDENGQRSSGLKNPLLTTEVLIAAGAGIGVAAIFFAIVNGSYNLKGSTYSYNLSKNANFRLLADEERYLRQVVTRTARSSGSSGGSGRSGGSHRSSSGRSHGGGGRRF